MRHAHLLRCHLLSNELKPLSNRDQVSHVGVVLSHVTYYTGRGRGEKVQGGETFLYSNKLALFIGWGGSGKKGGRGGGQWGGSHRNQGSYSGGQSAGFYWN